MALTLTEDYKLHKLIFVNSGSSAYLELPMNATGALFGNNNEGKTSGLSALKLFILPETNFKDCERKFAFQSGGTFYRADQSSNYYFPADNSFVICEAENPKGRFCMVLYRSKEEWGYGRIAIACAYQDIRHLFWNFDDTELNHGFGGQWPHLNLADTLKSLKKLGGKRLKTRQEIREAIYSRVGVIDDLSRFCLIPLIQKGERGSVDALRSLLSLAFDIKGSAKTTLPKALATIIEGENAVSERPMAIEIGAITTEYQQLKQRGEKLKKVEACVSQWEQLSDAVREYRQGQSRLVQQLPILHHSLQQHLTQVNQDYEQRQQALNEAQRQLGNQQQLMKQAEAELLSAQNQYALRDKDLKALQQKLTHIGELKQHYGEQDLASLSALIEKLIAKTDTQLASLQDQNAAKDNLLTLTQNLQQLQQQRNQLQLLLEQPEQSSPLSAHARQVLTSLNTQLANIAPISDKTLQSFEHFSDEFTIKDRGLYLADHYITSASLEEKETNKDYNKQRLEELTSRILEVESQRTVIQNSLDENQTEATKNDLLKQLHDQKQQLEQEAKLVAQAAFIEEQCQDLGTEIGKLEPEIALKQAAQAEAAEKLQAAQDACNKADNLLLALQPEKHSINDQQQQLNAVRLKLGLVVDSEVGQECLTRQEITPYLKQYLEAADNQPQRLLALREKLSHLLGQDLLEIDRQFLYAPEFDQQVALQAFEALRAVFENHQDNVHHYQNDISAHNHETSIRVALLSRVAETIDQFKTQINQSLGKYAISNLTAIALEISVDKRFSSLLQDMQQFDFSQQELASHQFYERLTSFCEDFFVDNKQGRRIQLDKIITGVQYHYEIDGRAEKASQSNGTNCMISTVLLAILLRRLVPEKIDVCIPIVFDEAGSLDAKNLRTIKQVVEENGFVLFIANPTNNGVIASVIENWFDLSMYRLQQGQIIGKCSVLHHNMEEGIRSIAPLEAS